VDSVAKRPEYRKPNGKIYAMSGEINIVLE
jgi:hypothetical protein